MFGVETAGDPRTYEGKPIVVTYFEYVHALLDSLGICFFTGNWTSPQGMSPSELAELYFLATGIETSEMEFMKTGERIHNIGKLFNVLHARFSRSDDYPPKRLMEEPIKSGRLKGEMLLKADWDKMLDEYYSLHGWDRFTGWPRSEKLIELGLDEFIPKYEILKQE
jgi:aldehyde:ferredoxin oxidoreductase